MSGKEKNKKQKTTKKQKRLEYDSLKDTKTKPKPKTSYLKYMFLQLQWTYQQTSADSVKWSLPQAAFSYDCYQHQGPWQAAKATVTTIKIESSSVLQLVQYSLHYVMKA